MKILVKIMIVLIIVLMLLGAIMVFTASGTYSLNRFNNFYYLFRSHLWKIVFALAGLIIFAFIPYDSYRKYSKTLLYIISGLLVVTLLFAPKVKGAARWIDLGFFQFQPSEAAKIILIMHLAYLIERKGELLRDFKNGFVYMLIWIGLISFLVLIQPNISTSLIIVITSFTLLYVGGAKLKHIAGILVPAIILLGGAVMLFQHSRERVFDYVDSLVTGRDINIQVTQAKIALGSGGITGIGLGQSRQSDLFLPESYGDFIFSILGEELGFFGTAIILFLYLGLFFICLIIAKKSKDRFGQLLVYGLALNILLSAFINAGVVTGLLPTTGITLPFISFGGSSILVYSISVGMILSVARQTVKSEELRMAAQAA